MENVDVWNLEQAMSFSEDETAKIWDKATFVSQENEKSGFRKDKCDAWIEKKQYGNRKSDFGWEADHIRRDGTDDLSNIQPLQWQNNVAKVMANLFVLRNLKEAKTSTHDEIVHTNLVS